MSKEENTIIKAINAGHCPFCKSLYINELPNSPNIYIQCNLCGNYELDTDIIFELEKSKDIIAEVLYYLNLEEHNKNLVNIIGDEQFYQSRKKHPSNSINRFLSFSLIKNLYPSTFSGKIHNILNAVAYKSQYMGEFIRIDYEEFCSMFYIKRFNQIGEEFSENIIRSQFLEMKDYFFKNTNYLQVNIPENNPYCTLKMLPSGWNLISESIKDFSKKVFIAMSFAKETESTREALKQGISKAGYTPVIIDELTHNHQIVPEMFKQIRDSKFLVIDVSVPNNGAYYEAGYALGLGKEVIFCCSQNSFEDKENRPHFDVSQKQMIVWKDETDLSDKLEKWIKSLFE